MRRLMQIYQKFAQGDITLSHGGTKSVDEREKIGKRRIEDERTTVWGQIR